MNFDNESESLESAVRGQESAAVRAVRAKVDLKETLMARWLGNIGRLAMSSRKPPCGYVGSAHPSLSRRTGLIRRKTAYELCLGYIPVFLPSRDRGALFCAAGKDGSKPSPAGREPVLLCLGRGGRTGAASGFDWAQSLAFTPDRGAREAMVGHRNSRQSGSAHCLQIFGIDYGDAGPASCGTTPAARDLFLHLSGHEPAR